MVEHKTFGQIATELLAKPDEKQGVVDTQREMNKNYYPSIYNLVTDPEQECSKWTEPFYIEVRNKKERLFINAMHQYFIARRSLPDPDYDQDVWKYFPATSDLKYLWSLPPLWAYNKLLNSIDITNDDKELLQFCKMYEAGILKRERGE